MLYILDKCKTLAAAIQGRLVHKVGEATAGLDARPPQLDDLAAL